MNPKQAYYVGEALADLLALSAGGKAGADERDGRDDVLSDQGDLLHGAVHTIAAAQLEAQEPFPPRPEAERTGWEDFLIFARTLGLVSALGGPAERRLARGIEYFLSACLAALTSQLRACFLQTLGDLEARIERLVRAGDSPSVVAESVLGLFKRYSQSPHRWVNRQCEEQLHIEGDRLRALMAFALPSRYGAARLSEAVPEHLTRLIRHIWQLLGEHVEGEVVLFLRLGFHLRALAQRLSPSTEIGAFFPELLPSVKGANVADGVHPAYHMASLCWKQLGATRAGFPDLRMPSIVYGGHTEEQVQSELGQQQFEDWASERRRDLRVYLNHQFAPRLVVRAPLGELGFEFELSYLGEVVSAKLILQGANAPLGQRRFLALLETLTEDLQAGRAVGWVPYRKLDADFESKAAQDLRTWRVRFNQRLDRVWQTILGEEDLDETVTRPLFIGKADQRRTAYRLGGLALDQAWNVVLDWPS